MTTPLVEMDGDEMTRVLWKLYQGRAAPPLLILTQNIMI